MKINQIKETVMILETPKNRFPLDGAKNITKTSRNSIVLTWDPVPGTYPVGSAGDGLPADAYEVQIGTTPDLDKLGNEVAPIIINDTVYEFSEFNGNPIGSNIFWWRVRAITYNPDYAESAWSPAWTFSAEPIKDSTLMQAPVIVWPVEGCDIDEYVSDKYVFEWDSVPNADKYLLDISSNENFEGTLELSDESDTTYYETTTTNLVNNTKYWLRVKAWNPRDTKAPYAVCSFMSGNVQHEKRYFFRSIWNKLRGK